MLSLPQVGCGAGLVGDVEWALYLPAWQFHISEPHDHLETLPRAEEGLGRAVGCSQ